MYGDPIPRRGSSNEGGTNAERQSGRAEAAAGVLQRSARPLDEIEPHHIKQYLRDRGKKAPIRANREKALMSAIWNFAREYGYTSLANPCAGVKGHKETGRGVYIEDDVFASVYEKGYAPLRDTMDLAYLTGQRMADVLKMDERDIVGGYLSIRQNKTAAMQRMEVAGQLEEVLKHISARKAALKVMSTIDHHR